MIMRCWLNLTCKYVRQRVLANWRRSRLYFPGSNFQSSSSVWQWWLWWWRWCQHAQIANGSFSMLYNSPQQSWLFVFSHPQFSALVSISKSQRWKITSSSEALTQIWTGLKLLQPKKCSEPSGNQPNKCSMLLEGCCLVFWTKKWTDREIRQASNETSMSSNRRLGWGTTTTTKTTITTTTTTTTMTTTTVSYNSNVQWSCYLLGVNDKELLCDINIWWSCLVGLSAI